jgi:hypothetical protein
VTRFGWVVWLTLTVWFAFLATVSSLVKGLPWWAGSSWLPAGLMSVFLLVLLRVVRM